MTKPDWCPADVWAAAKQVSDDLNDTEWHTTYYDTPIIARAILAERDRALEAVISLIDEGSYKDAAGYIETTSDDHDAIIEAIRALKETP